jgi:N-acetylmuramic acid 6-phosphate etherase
MTARHDLPPRRGHLITEQPNPASLDLDQADLGTAFDLMNAQDATVAEAVRNAKKDICQAIELVSARLRQGGRLIYVGAGTSGRLGVIDAAECPPTFLSDPSTVQAVIAGGPQAVFRSVEHAEDNAEAARQDLEALNPGPGDVVFGISTGGTARYVREALACGREHGTATVFLACVPSDDVADDADVSIRVITGPEVLAGSTRLKAGTATKMVLNMVTTLSMVRLGKVYRNLMVDLNARACEKLTDRATRTIAMLTGLSYEDAHALLDRADGRVKTALVMHRFDCSAAQADARLRRHEGHLREALGTDRNPSG